MPIVDVHSHYGMIARPMRRSGLAEDMRAERIAIVVWALPSDLRWIRGGRRASSSAASPSRVLKEALAARR